VAKLEAKVEWPLFPDTVYGLQPHIDIY